MNARWTDDVVKTVKSSFKKHEFLQFVESQVGLRIPRSYSFSQALDYISESKKEAEFCKAWTGFNTLARASEYIEALNALNLLVKGELELLAHYLPEHRRPPTWLSWEELVEDLARKFRLNKLDDAIRRAVAAGEVASFTQSENFTIGPLGVVRAKASRKPSEALTLADLLRTTLSEPYIDSFMQTSEAVNRNFCATDYPHPMDAFIQRVLADCTEEQILATLNSMIESELLLVDSTSEVEWEYVCSPNGVFKKVYWPELEDLANIIVSHADVEALKNTLEKKGIKKGTLAQRVMEFCVIESPYALGIFFEIGQLKVIAKELQLVRVGHLGGEDREMLWRMILLRLGFWIPPTLAGIEDMHQALLSKKSELKSMPGKSLKDAASNVQGIVVILYRGLERLLKSAIYFHVALLWSEEIDALEKPREKLEKANGILCEEVDVREELRHKVRAGTLSFGELIEILRCLDKAVAGKTELGKKLSTKLEQYSGRRSILQQRINKMLNTISEERKRYVHDVTDVVQPSVQDALELVDKMETFLSIAVDTGVYPELIWMKKRVTNEFGVEYYEVENERNEVRRICTDMHLEGSRPYLLASLMNPASVEPFITDLFWN